MSSENMVVQIKNYQRIRSAKMEFVPGLNAIIGQTNNGKSSIFRALETTFYNVSRERHVSLGETKSAVGVRYNGHEVIWRRDTEAASQVSYRVDGKIYSKLGKGQPEVVRDALGIREVEINEQKFRVNISKQMSYPFLLDITPSELFKFIIQSSEEDNIVEVLNNMRSDINQIQVNVSNYEASRNSVGIALTREVKKYKSKKHLIPYCNKIISLDPKVKKYESLKQTSENVIKLEGEIDRNTERLKELSKKSEEVSKRIDTLRELIIKIEDLTGSVELLEKKNNELLRVEEEKKIKVKRLDTIREVSSYKDKINDLQLLKAKKESIEDSIRRYMESGKKGKSSSVERKEKRSKIQKIDKIVSFLDDSLARVRELKEDMKDIETGIQEIEGLNVEIEKNNDEKELKRKRINEIVEEQKEIGVCPYCGSRIGG